MTKGQVIWAGVIIAVTNAMCAVLALDNGQFRDVAVFAILSLCGCAIVVREYDGEGVGR